MITPKLYGLVLIGGESRRMGKDKSLLSYHSKNQRAHSYELLSGCCNKVFLSCNANQTPEVTQPFIEDSKDYLGPLAGLLSAQEKFRDVAWLVLACDMPFVDEELLDMLVRYRDPKALATCFYHGFPEPLCTIWEPSSYKALIQFVNSGNLRPKQFLKENTVKYIHTNSEIKDKFRNINSPDENVN
ncbi:NTP transferase domain-containing protein [Fulvivirga sp. 29W222]|uniref:NTP transferase domain-containing protein n=1 Tax=Fulvivirga marina TaxID=2494733 RepID=A0A937FXX2_9BACT|nr:NTP transferase domain-containing protein [Fulvivirga marina]MBL6448165.1 NTP transferase domain-containing protein [Fulvivirga marina]